eukprot:3412784-Rhodomonas_salina.6
MRSAATHSVRKSRLQVLWIGHSDALTRLRRDGCSFMLSGWSAECRIDVYAGHWIRGVNAGGDSDTASFKCNPILEMKVLSPSGHALAQTTRRPYRNSTQHAVEWNVVRRDVSLCRQALIMMVHATHDHRHGAIRKLSADRCVLDPPLRRRQTAWWSSRCISQTCGRCCS